MIPRPSARGRLMWALLIVACTSVVLAKSEANAGRQQVAKQQEAAKQQAIAAAPIEAIEPQASLTSKQEAADKKQGDQAVDASFNTEEYVQIKPEEISGEAAGKADIDSAVLALSDLPVAGASQSGLANAQASGQQQPLVAEHKSAADEELSAHLAHDSIGALESGPRPYATPPADARAIRPYGPVQAPRAGPGYMQQQQQQQQPSRHYGQPASRPPRAYGPPRSRRPGPYKPMPPPPPPGYGRAPRMPMPPGPRYPSPQRLPGTPGYISSMVPHAPRPSHYGAAPQTAGPYNQPPRPSTPAANYPKGQVHPSGPAPSSAAAPSRYLPRGAAAGYAAFREFVRAQANRYKGQQHSLSSHEPIAYNAAPSSFGPSYGPGQAMVEMAVGGASNADQANKPYHHQAEPLASSHPKAAQPNYSNGPEHYGSAQAAGPQSAPSHSSAAPPSKVTVAQAYIPHLAPPGGAHQQPSGGYLAQASSPSASQPSYGQNPVLAKLYGGHAPHGMGRPEYNKDFGMVIHYPQATVYTEPMTVDQLHKLAGSSITHVIEQLQHNLAHGQRNEANTIRANSEHHLGHGLAIHAKEYYAPGKSGHYVPTTAAVISSHHEGESYAGPTGQYGGELPAASYHQQQQPPQPHPQQHQHQHQPELGSGYERVKAAVAASAKSAMKYGSAVGAVGKAQIGGGYGENDGAQQAQHSLASSSGGLSGLMKPYEPLGALANIIGSELESLYNKANSVLSKQIDPELHAHVQAHLKSIAKVAGPLKISEHDHRSPLAFRPHHGQSYGGPQGQSPPPPGPVQSYRTPSQSYSVPQAHRMPYEPLAAAGRAPRRPMGYEAQGGFRQAMSNRYRSRPERPIASHQQQQQQNYQTEQQAFQHQVNQMLNDFNLGEDNYGAKSQPIQATNQGYPNKVIQKHQAQSYQQANLAYEHGEGLEIPQGPNDQIGEISDLIESLKGSLEGHKPETGAAKDAKSEDVEYITSTLGQVPSYAIQVPVGQHQSAGEQAVYESAQKAEQQQQTQQYQQQPQQYQQQPQQYQQQSQQYQQQPQQYQQQRNQYQQQSQQPQQHYQQQPQQQHYTSQIPAAFQEPHALTIQHDVYQPQGAQVGATALPYQAPPAPVAPVSSNYEPAAPAGHGHEQPTSGSGHQQQQQQNDYHQNQPQPQVYGQYSQQAAAQQEPAGYSRPAPAESYSAQPQPISHQQTESYAPNQQQQAPAQDYGKAPAQDYNNNQQQQQHHEQSSSYESPAQTGAYGHEQHQPTQQAVEQVSQQQYAQQQQQQQQQQPQPQQASYGSVGHTQVINHLVPAQQQAAAEYGSQKQAQALTAITSSISHQPVNQISVAAPTESQYQSAQPLSSFVESLPSDYQELLRQPQAHASLLESITSGAGNGQNQHGQLYSNATTSHDIAKVHQVSSQQVAGAQHQHQRRQYDSHHLSASASSPKATYLQKPAASSTGSSKTAAVQTLQSATSSASVPSPSSSSSSSSASSPTSSSSSSSSPASAAASVAKAVASSQQDNQ